jgi:hypothetical protein
MKRMFLLVGLAVLCASLGWAQETPAQSDPSTSSAASTSTGTIKGCLSGSDGDYTLTQDETGTMYRLVGSDSKLKDHVGHEVLVTGQLINAGSAASTTDQEQSDSSTSKSAGGSAFQVSDIKMVSKRCRLENDKRQSH